MRSVNCNINNREYHVRSRFDREPSKIPVKKNYKSSHVKTKKKKKKLVRRRILKKFQLQM